MSGEVCGLGCDRVVVWRVKARVPSAATSRLGNRSYQSTCCGDHLEVTVRAALGQISYSAPAKVEYLR